MPPSSKKNQGGKKRGCAPLFFFLIVVGLLASPLIIYFSGSAGKVKRGLIEIVEAFKRPSEPEYVEVERIVEKEKIVEKEVPAPPEPPPSRFVPYKKIDTAELYNGLDVRSVLETKQGPVATAARKDPRAYEIEMRINIKVPKANQSVADLAALNPHLPKVLPDLEAMVKGGKVSGFYHKLYELKTERVQRYLTRFDRVLSRHNFFDCETILELQHPSTGQKVLLLQGEMDVVSDGSDGDRLPKIDDYISMSANYQPFTSYGWSKQSKTPNPLLSRWEADLKKVEDEYAIPGLTVERNRYLRARIEELKREIADIKARSFLIAEADPFVVMPLSLLGQTEVDPYGPAIGDYAVVIYEDKVYPAIVGDAGPSFQMGEASLRIAKEIDENSNPYRRPVSDLKVSYLVFPGSAEEKRTAPDLKVWHAKCSDLLAGLGGLGEGYVLHEWEDLIAKKTNPPAPAPEPTPTPAPETASPGDSDAPEGETASPPAPDAPAQPAPDPDGEEEAAGGDEEAPQPEGATVPEE